MSDLGHANWSETDASNNAAAPNGWPEGMNASDVNNSARAVAGAAKRWWNRSNSVKTTGGSSTVMTLTYDIAAAAYYNGEHHSFIVGTTCGSAPTLNINSVGAKNLRKFSAGAWANLAAADIVADQVITVRYNSSADKFDVIGMSINVVDFVLASLLTTRGDMFRRGASALERLALGTAGYFLKSDGTDFVWAALTATGATVRVQPFVIGGGASQTYTPHANMVTCLIECIGGGGGGGGTADTNANIGSGAAGGGAGSLARKWATAADIGASKAVTLGAAGAAGSAGNNAGGNGGDTEVAGLCIGKGGSGGAGSAGGVGGTLNAGGLGGVAGTGDDTPTGAPGESSYVSTILIGFGRGGAGASSPYGGGGRSKTVVTTTNATGEAATGAGAGGSGGASYSTGGTAAGGAGTAGKVVIWEFCSS